MKEIEAKYLCVAGISAKTVRTRIRKCLKKGGFLVSPFTTTKIRDTYFDSSNHVLEQRNISLRQRKGEQSEWTLKSDNTETAFFSRKEINQQSPNRTLQPPDEGPISEQLHRILRQDEQLRPVLSLKNRRAVSMVCHPSHADETGFLSVDKVTSEHGLTFIEIEFEVRHSSMDLMLAVMRKLQADETLYLSRLSKYARCRYSHAPLGFQAPEFDSLAEDCNWAGSASRLLADLNHHLNKLEPFAWEGLHPEGVHQMRVVTRKVLAVLTLFANELPRDLVRPVKVDMKRLARALGSVRDLDVQLLRINRAPYGLDDFVAHLNDDRLHRHAELRTLLSSRFISMSENMNQLALYLRRLQDQLPQMSSRMPGESEQTFFAHLGKVLELGHSKVLTTNDRASHRLRQHLKVSAYQLNMLHCKNHKITGLRKSARKLLSMLGHQQDANIAAGRLARYAKNHTREKQQVSAYKSLLAQQRVHHKQFKKRWKSFETQVSQLLREQPDLELEKF